MASASALGWGKGWPNCVSDEVVTAVVGEGRLRLPVRRQIVPLVAGLVADLEAARGRPFRADWSWGFACRAIAGTRSPSNHSQGCAIDLDAPENPHLSASAHASAHPLRKRIGGRLLRTTMPDDVAAIAERWGFGWGGLYAKPDPMHFEIALTPAGAARRIADLRALDGRPVTTKPPALQEDDMRLVRPIHNQADKNAVWLIMGSNYGPLGTPREQDGFEKNLKLKVEEIGNDEWAAIRRVGTLRS